MKRTIGKLLAVCLALFVSVGSTIAYLSDTDEAVNVMTLGQVAIDLIEQERASNGTLFPFEDDHPLYPGVYPAEAVTGTEADYWPADVHGAIDKIVSVKNTGRSEAYVRIWFAFEVTDEEDFFDKKLHLNRNGADWAWQFLKESDGTYTVLEQNGTRYVVAVSTYDEILPADEITPVSLRQVLLDAAATNADMAVLGDKYSIFVVAQAVQAQGFDDAAHALNEGFGAATLANHPFAGMMEGETASSSGNGALSRSDLRTALTTLPDGTELSLTDRFGNTNSMIMSVTFGTPEQYGELVKSAKFSRPLDTEGSGSDATGWLMRSAKASPSAPEAFYMPHKKDESTGTYYFDVYILCDGEIILPENSAGLFEGMDNMKTFRASNLNAHEVKDLDKFFSGCTQLTYVMVPEGVTQIDEDFFSNCSNLDIVSLPDSVQVIEPKAFDESKPDVTFVIVKDSYGDKWCDDNDKKHDNQDERTSEFHYNVNEDGTATITGFSGTEIHVVIPQTLDGHKVTTIGFQAFYGLPFESVVIPEGVKTIEFFAFGECRQLESVVLPESLETMGVSVFGGCSALKSIRIPASVTAMHEVSWQFEYCYGLQEILVDENNPKYTSKDGVLYAKDMKTMLHYPLGKYAKSYTIPEGVETLPEWCFHESKLEQVKLPSTLKRIEDAAFYNCNNLKELTIPAGVSYISEENGGFAGACDQLESITVEKGNATYLSKDGVLYRRDDEGDMIFLMRYPAGKKDKDFTMPEWDQYYQAVSKNAFEGALHLKTVTMNAGGVEEYTFRDCISLETVHDTLWFVEMGAFAGCSKLKNITIAPQITSIRSDAFRECASLKPFALPESLERIGDFAFVGCNKWEEVVIPEGIQYLGENVFYNCKNLKKVYLPASLTRIMELENYEKWDFTYEDAFWGINDRVKFYVSAGSEAERFCQVFNQQYEIID